MLNKRLYNNTYLHSIYSYFHYSETNKYYLNSKSSNRKIKEPFRFIILFNENEIIKKSNLFLYSNLLYKHKFILFNDSLIEKEKNLFFKETFYENKSRIKIIGRGWKIIKYPYELLIKLGYSHPIFLTLNPFFKHKLKKKKKKYYTFYGVKYEEINTLMGKFNFMRIPDTYTRKGIFHHKIIL